MKILNTYGLQAITTKYLAPTNYRGARVKAKAACGCRTIQWDHSLSVDENHNQAALEFAKSKGWDISGDLVYGGSPDGFGNVYVILDENMTKEV